MPDVQELRPPARAGRSVGVHRDTPLERNHNSEPPNHPAITDPVLYSTQRHFWVHLEEVEQSACIEVNGLCAD